VWEVHGNIRLGIHKLDRRVILKSILEKQIKGKKKSKVFPVLFLTEHHAMKAYWGSGYITPRILDPGARWRLMVNFTPRQLYP
jgi:hypothetical protein